MLLPLVAHAQGGNSGSIVGYIYDQTGNPIKGVKLTASSPTQIGGGRSTYSNDEGYFRFSALFPGVFEVRATAPKLRTYIQKEIKVGISAAAEISLVMEVESAGVEEVKVVEKAPTVSTTTSNVKEVYDLDFVESMPFNSRDQVFNQMVGQIGGAVGNRVRGGAGNQTIFTQDGFDMRDQYPVTKSSAAYEIQSAGYGADNATASGGLVNLVTKTGSNKWEFEFNATYEDEWMRLGKDNRDGKGNYYYVANPAIAGPIIRDKLWFAFTAEAHLLGKSYEEDVEGVIPRTPGHQKGINKGTLKITWQATTRNKLTFLSNFDSAWQTNMRTDLGIEQEAQQNRRAGLSGLWGLILESLVTDNLIFRAQAAYSTRPQHWYPWLCEDDPVGCLHVPSVIQKFPRRVESSNAAKGCGGAGECGGASSSPHRRYDLFVYQASSQVQWFPTTKLLGEHSLTLKNQFYTEQEILRHEQPGNTIEEFNGPGARESLTTYYSNDPRFEPARYGWWIGTDTIYRNNASLSDSWRPVRYLTLTPAISYVWTKGTNSYGETAIDSATWAPSVTAAWDATRDGRTVLRGSYSNYVDVSIRDVVLHTGGSQTSQRCLWNDATGKYDRSCVYSGGATRNTLGSPCGPAGINPDGTSCLEALKAPRTFEYTIGAEREIIQGVALSVDLVYRKFTHQYERNETNQIWDPSGSAVLGYRDGRPQQVVDMGTPEGANRYYAGLTAGLNKREGVVRVYASYTLSQLKGSVFNGSGNAWGDIPGRDDYLTGYGPDDHRHDFKASMQVAATKWLSAGVRYDFQTGFPYNRLFRNDVTGSYENYRATMGMNPGTNLNDPRDDRSLRLPDRQELNLQLRFSMLPLIGHKLDFYVDALNLLNSRTTTSFGQNDGTNFGLQTGWQAPFRMRFGLNYRY